MPTLAELLRLNDGQQAYVGYPQMQVGLNKPRQTGYATGFLENATGLPPMQSQGVLTNPNYDAYAKGQNAGELAGIGAMAIPAALMAKTLRTAKPVQATSTLDPIGQRYQNRLDKEYSTLVNDYAKLEESRGGKVLNTDIARELSPEYAANRTLSANVHEPASAFVKQLYAEKLAQPAKPNSTVLFTGGGTGAGKTTALEKLFPNISQQAEMIYDTNLNKLESATKKIDQALDAGRNVNIVYVYRDPVESLTEGALTRAERMKKELGSGRTVPIEEHLKTHVGVREVIPQLMEQYKDNPKVSIGVINNTFGKGNARASTLEELPMFNPAEMSTKLRDALENELKAGKISKETYEGTLGK
jgi:hypothetical protein